MNNVLSYNVIFLVVLTAVTLLLSNGGKGDFRLHAGDLETYGRDGILAVRDRPLFDEDRLANITEELLNRVNARPAGTRPEDVINLHFEDAFLLSLAADPAAVRAVAALLNSPNRVRIFMTRILCKMAGTGEEIPWHQDSMYWPLTETRVVTLWLALDDTTPENGCMRMMTFDALPGSRGRNLPVVTEGEDRHGNFPWKLADGVLSRDVEANSTLMDLKRGQFEFHDAFVLHSSGPNRSPRRRCSWIARYLADGAEVRRGERPFFNDEYKIFDVDVE